MAAQLAVPTTEEEAEENRAKLVTSKTAWKKAAVHRGVVCPSGAVISVQIPDLAKLAESGEIPNELVDIATAAGSSAQADIPADALQKLNALQKFLLVATVVEPAITEADVDDLPTEDKTFISEIANRQRDVDALGNSIAGLDRVAKYATFREESSSDEAFLDA